MWTFIRFLSTVERSEKTCCKLSQNRKKRIQLLTAWFCCHLISLNLWKTKFSGVCSSILNHYMSVHVWDRLISRLLLGRLLGAVSDGIALGWREGRKELVALSTLPPVCSSGRRILPDTQAPPSTFTIISCLFNYHFLLPLPLSSVWPSGNSSGASLERCSGLY